MPNLRVDAGEHPDDEGRSQQAGMPNREERELGQNASHRGQHPLYWRNEVFILIHTVAGPCLRFDQFTTISSNGLTG